MALRKHFFSKTDSQAIVKAIGDAEAMTSGEIRVHVEPRCEGDVLERATTVFAKLNMNQTAQGNGVLIYLAYEDRKFAILGDKGIDRVVPANFWDGVKKVLVGHFKKDEFLAGIVFAIKETGIHLKQYFPIEEGDKNELPNEISEG